MTPRLTLAMMAVSFIAGIVLGVVLARMTGAP